MAGLRVEESRKLMSPNSDISFDELESSRPKPSSARSSGSDYAFTMSKGNGSRGFCNFKMPNGRQLRLIVSVSVAIVVAVFVYLIWTPSHRRPIVWNAPAIPPTPTFPTSSESTPSKPHSEESSGVQTWVKPTGFKIVGLVFYGRPRYVNVLDCYLKKNLVSNGGYLDEIVFMVNTKFEEDQKWLDELIETEPLYQKKITVSLGGHFDNIWNRHAQDENTLYIKIDDDIVYVHEDAIPRMVHTLMDHPEAHDVAANIINSPLTHWIHYHTEAILPYMPDTSNLNGTNDDPTSWRASQLPHFSGPTNDTWEFHEKPKGGFPVGSTGGPPSDGHRWLPMAPTSENLMKTPIAAGKAYDPWGKGWTEWTLAAQQHYSLLERLETEETGKYWAGNQEGIWNMQYTRYNLNFLAIWGKSVKMMGVAADDEDALTVTIPKALKRPCIIDTHAIVSHFSFGTTPELEKTDLLERYRLYANEKVCTADNQKKKLEPQFYVYHKNW